MVTYNPQLMTMENTEDMFDFTIDEICQGMIDRFNYRPSVDFDGDTVDREWVCEMILDARERTEAA